jgi:hypothetical protein
VLDVDEEYKSDFESPLPTTALQVFEFVERRRTELTAAEFERWHRLMIEHHLGSETS